jgi:hypothetical protein
MGGKGLNKVIYEPILKIWEEAIIPHEWKIGMICPIDKKRTMIMCNNYRASTLPCTYCKFWQIFYI